VFGGEHPDVPLEESAGETVARVVVEKRIPAILDCGLMRKGARTRFMQDFCEALYHRNREPLHFFVDEAHTLAPQKPMPDTARLLGAVEDIVLQGRRRGLGLTVISQRPALVNTNVRTQCSTLIAMRVIGPHDLKAIEDWTDAHGTPEQSAELLESLPTLKTGEGWVWAPGSAVFDRVRFRQRETFDSSATPEVGKRVVTPKVVAEIDLAALGEQIKATVEKAKADDPKELRKEIAALKKQLAERPAEQVTVEKLVEVPVLKNGQLDRTEKIITRLEAVGQKAVAEAIELRRLITPAAPLVQNSATKRPMYQATPQTAKTPAYTAAAGGTFSRPKPASVPADPDAKLSKAERLILTALAQYPAGRTLVQVAVLTGYAHSGGGFRNALGALRTKEAVAGGAESLRITDVGLSLLGDFTPLPTGDALLQHWRSQLGKAEREILDVLAARHPDRMTLEQVAAETPSRYAPDGGGFRNAVGRLRSLELIEGRGEVKASDDLFG
jgi:hypothetical protein